MRPASGSNCTKYPTHQSQGRPTCSASRERRGTRTPVPTSGGDPAPLWADGVKHTKAEIKGGRRDRTRKEGSQLGKIQEARIYRVSPASLVLDGGIVGSPRNTTFPPPSVSLLCSHSHPTPLPKSCQFPALPDFSSCNSPLLHFKGPGRRVPLAYPHCSPSSAWSHSSTLRYLLSPLALT